MSQPLLCRHINKQFIMEHIEHINKVELQGHVGTVRTNEHNGVKVVNFTLATELLYKTRESGAISEITWHNIVAWDNSQMPDLDRITKGTPVNVTGRIRINRLKLADGTERQFHEILANRIKILREQA